MPFQASIDEVAVYNQVFTDTDVANQDAPAPSTAIDHPTWAVPAPLVALLLE
jgi:hypothetical protein